jgi:uncharacterized protein
MHHVLRTGAIGCLVVLLTGAAPSVQAPDLLPADWERAGPIEAAASYAVHVDRQIRRTGTNSVRLESLTDRPAQFVGLRQTFLADEFRGRRVRVAGFVRVSGVTGSASLFMRVDGSAANTFLDNMMDRALRGTADWRRLESVLDVPKDATAIVIGFLLSGGGAMWADDLEFTVVDETVATTGMMLPPAEVSLAANLPRAPRNLDFEGGTVEKTVPVSATERRGVMIPMRDGVQLYTEILAPRSVQEPLPILLVRTPYGAYAAPSDTRRALGDYISVSQDIRGRNKSQGEFVMNRPARDRRDPKSVDETTDAYDTVEWLIRNVPGNNGRVGVSGVSYPGWLAEAVLLEPHPAVKAVSPQAPMTDTWMGDDFFHQGAFRQWYGFSYAWGMEGAKAGAGTMPVRRADDYEWFLSFPSLKDLTDKTGAMRLPTWRRFVEHPAWDAEWQGRAFQRLVTSLPVPTLNVGGWWDQEDLFGPQATYTALERFDTKSLNSLVVGPWCHGCWDGPADSLGTLRFGAATGTYFHEQIESPWFAYWLKGRGDGRFPDAYLFDAGTNQWRTFDRWPPPEARPRQLYVLANGQLSFDPPTGTSGFDEFISDPAHPVPYAPRTARAGWSRWMTEDQRFVDGRPDVLTWQTEPLASDVVVAGEVAGRLYASTSGTDADWVVKLIDVYPHETRDRPEMADYQLMVTGDIMRGRYRQGYDKAEPIRANAVNAYTVDLHQLYYTFKAGHRVMVQVQSTWFPLYDRNPQTFVANIFEAAAAAYRAQTHRVYRTASQPSHVRVMVVPR